MPDEDLGSGSQFAKHQEAARVIQQGGSRGDFRFTKLKALQVAMAHYASCKEGGGSYIGAYFNAVSDTAAGYASRGLNGVE